MKSNQKVLVSVVGPTAVGKTKVAIEIARYFDTEIISADSRQFYREMEIGTAKPDAEELAAAPHHFINSHSINAYYSAGMFEREALAKLDELFQNNHVVVAVGGSGLFFKALWEGFDEMPKVSTVIREELKNILHTKGIEPLLEELKERDPAHYEIVDHKNYQRILRALEVIRSSGKTYTELRKGHQTSSRDFCNVKIGLNMERPLLFDRINQRMDVMIDHGLFEEAEKLIAHRTHNALKTVGYTEIFEYLDGAYDKEEAIRLLKRNSRRYAKRQVTWFKKDEEVQWYEPDQMDEMIRFIQDELNT